MTVQVPNLALTQTKRITVLPGQMAENIHFLGCIVSFDRIIREGWVEID
jgi:hypothetical protein